MRKIFNLVIYILGCLALFIILDKLAGKLLLKFDPEFAKILLAKFKKPDIQLTREQVIPILRKEKDNAVAEIINGN